MKKTLRYLLCWLVTVALVVWVLSRIPLDEITQQWTQAKWAHILMACVLSAVGNILFACQKYRLILRLLGARITLREVIILKVGSIPVKALLPMKAGEMVRLIYLKRHQDLSYARGVGLSLINFSTSLVALALFWGAGWGIALAKSTSSPSFFALPTGVLFLLGAMSLCPKGIDKGWAVGRISRIWSLFWRNRGSVFLLLLLSLTFEGIKVLNYALVFRSLGIAVSLGGILKTAPMVILFSSLPLSIMGIGAREGGVVVAFAGVAQEATLAAAGIWISVVEAVLPMMMGLGLLAPFLNRLLSVRDPHQLNCGERVGQGTCSFMERGMETGQIKAKDARGRGR